MKRSSFFLILMLVFAGCAQKAPEPIIIYMIGDSTMANKPNPDQNPERGWGQMLPLFFTDHVTIDNRAVNGRSTRSFINQGRWKAIYDSLKPGNYVFIQFGHNDSKSNDSSRFTNPHTAYRHNLMRFALCAGSPRKEGHSGYFQFHCKAKF